MTGTVDAPRLRTAVMAGDGLAPLANLNLSPEGHFPSPSGPAHGSAPDMAGLGIANPIEQSGTGAWR